MSNLQNNSCSLQVSPVSDSVDHMQLLTSPHSLCLHIRGQSIHKFFQSSAIIRRQGCFQGMTQRAFQAALPAFTPVVQIGSPPRQFSGWVYLHSIRSPHNTNHLSLGQNFSAAHARPLRHMFYALNRFLRHLHLKSLRVQWHINYTTNLHREHRRRACVSCARQLRHVLHQIPTRRFSSCPSCPSFYQLNLPLHHRQFGISPAS